MKRLPTPQALATSIDYSQEALARIRLHSADLLRRRQHDAGRDGFPASAVGGGGSSGTPSSSTETAALAAPMADPVARYIDDLLSDVSQVDKLLQHASNCLANVRQIDQEQRGRQSTVESCEACESPISGIGDDRRRNGFCPACYKSWLRWRPGAEDPTARAVFVGWRRQRLDEAVDNGVG